MIILHVFDKDFERRAVINTYTSLTWEEDYSDIGGFILVMPDTLSGQINVGDYLFRSDKQTAMIVVNMEIKSSLKQVAFTGYSTLHILSKRIIRNTINVTNAELGMRQMLQDNIRGMTRIGLAPLRGLDEVLTVQYTYNEVLPSIVEVATATKLGIRMIFDRQNKQHLFDVYRGIDRRVTQSENVRAFFSEEFKNIYNLEINDDFSFFKNVAIVGGAGEGMARVVIEVGTATGDDRYEMFVDAREIQPVAGETTSSQSYRDKLAGKGIAKLSEYIRRQSFKVEVDPAKFGKSYNLGDLISCKSTRYAVQFSARITKSTEISEGNIVKTKLTVGDTTLDAIGEMKLWR